MSQVHDVLARRPLPVVSLRHLLEPTGVLFTHTDCVRENARDPAGEKHHDNGGPSVCLGSHRP